MNLLTGLASIISGFKHLLSKTEFTVYVDHSALCHILKAKRQAPTLRLRKFIKYSLKKPERSEQTIIDVTVKNDPHALPVQNEPPVQPVIPVVKPKRKYTKKSKDTPTTTPKKVPHDQIIDPVAGEDIAEIPSEPYKLIKLNPMYMTLLYLLLTQRKCPQRFHPSYLKITCLVYHLNQHTKVQINLPFKLESQLLKV